MMRILTACLFAAAGLLMAEDVRPARTFNKDVLPILQKQCQECHRPGQIGPMSLLTYRHATAWAETMREVIRF